MQSGSPRSIVGLRPERAPGASGLAVTSTVCDRPQTVLIKLTKAKETMSYTWHQPFEEDGIEGACRSR